MAQNLRLFVFLVVLHLCSGGKVLKRVSINKCCDVNETLLNDRTCVKSDNNSWNVNVYIPAKHNIEKRIPINWNIKYNIRPKCEKPVFYRGTNSFVPFINGSVYVVEYAQFLQPSQYCLEYNATILCLDHFMQPGQQVSKVNIKKCCLSNSIFSVTKSACIPMQDKGYKVDVGEDHNLIYGFPECPADNKIAVIGKLNDSMFEVNGSLWSKNNKTLIQPGNFCLEHILEEAGQTPSIIACHFKKSEYDLRFTLYPIGLGLSVVFLAATLVAGSLLPASHHVLHWRCQTNHVGCLLVGDVILCIVQSLGNRKPPESLCLSMALGMYFFFLSAFFWLNTMCFNIWWTFRDLRPQSTEKRQERLRLRIYEVYAWGIPLVATATAGIVDKTDFDFIKPKFGQGMCWFTNNMLLYFYGPIGFLLCINLLLFLLTARELTCGLWKRELVKSTTERAALGRVCMKLVIVMGVTWIADILSWALDGPQEVWYLTDIINCLQGVFIFIVVGCQPQVLSAVKRLWGMRYRQSGTAGTTNHHSSSSQGPGSMGDTLTNTNSVTHNNTTKSSIPLEPC